jgi:GNAT superfamily N-acetyltransferase
MQAHERETLTAMVIADYLTAREPLRNACWIAEQDGVSVGASVLMAESGQSARNAVLFVEPGARRGGAGRRLIKACVTFAGESGYDRIVCGSDPGSDRVAPPLRSFGFETRRDATGWEAALEGARRR